MSISKSKILQDLNINENTLKEILNNLDYTDIATKEKSTIPEEIAYILYGIRFNGDSKRLIKKIIQDETNINQEVFNDIKIVGHIKLEDHTKDKNTYDYYSKENIGYLFRNKSVFCNHTSFWLE